MNRRRVTIEAIRKAASLAGVRLIRGSFSEKVDGKLTGCCALMALYVADEFGDAGLLRITDHIAQQLGRRYFTGFANGWDFGTVPEKPQKFNSPEDKEQYMEGFTDGRAAAIAIFGAMY